MTLKMFEILPTNHLFGCVHSAKLTSMNELINTAVVTGGASGLGQALVSKLSESGFKVTVLDRHDGPPLASVRYVICDVTSESEVKNALNDSAEKYGAARLIVNCAGVGKNARLLGRKGVHTLELFREVMDVNVLGTFNVLRLAAEQMIELPLTENGQRGVIINISSIAAFDGQIGQAAYSASKAAVAGMTLPLARELGKHAIRVVTICPGVFMTPMVQAHVTQEVLDGLLQNAAWPKRPGKPEEFAEFVMAVAANPMINGETIRLDGGLRMPSL
jgi:NAD(P)-dependent dehydrogenase (short-subunit alcohol dehydrogenase family)